jgi:outer membrane protein OmpA-like peptidoglycan-associated protein
VETKRDVIEHIAYSIVLWLTVLPYSAGGQQLQGKTVGYSSKVLDLVFRVDDIGGKVQSLDVKETATEVRIDLAADVLFDFDKSDLLPKAQQTLSQAASFIHDKAKGTVRIDGYTDAKGSDAYNQRLSERRAAAVETWFKTKGNLQKVSFVTAGYGAKDPVAPNVKSDGSDDPLGRQKNRRVEIVIRK